jgi:hypothetical protein
MKNSAPSHIGCLNIVSKRDAMVPRDPIVGGLRKLGIAKRHE